MGVVGVYTQDATTPANTTSHYLHKDHLGSVVKVTDSDSPTPATVAEYSYDAWGKPRNAATWADDLTSWPDHETDRGFTGHEMLAGVELVHMNGRIYDPLLGRFLSADPFVQSPDNLQSYNRYSYVLNNPISFTDPSGFFFKKLFRAIGNALKQLFHAIVVTFLSAIPVIGPYLALAFVAYLGYKSNGIQGAIFAVLTYNSAQGGGSGSARSPPASLSLFGGDDDNGGFGKMLRQVVLMVIRVLLGGTDRSGNGKFSNGAGTASFQQMWQSWGFWGGSNPIETEPEIDFGYWGKRLLALVVDLIPIVGGIKGILDLLAGEDIILGTEINRAEVIVQIILGFLGYRALLKLAKAIKKAIKSYRAARKARKTAKYEDGSHTVFRVDKSTGKVAHYETKIPQTNPRNPNPWEVEKRFDGQGPDHFNKATQTDVPTPHVHEKGTLGGVRPALPEELPQGF